MDVLLDEAGRLACAPRNLIEGRNHFDSFPLTRCLWLHDPQLISILSHLNLQLLVLLGAIIGGGHKIEVLVAVEGLHPRVPLVETVLSSDFITPREVVNLLEPTQIAVNI